MKKKEVYVVEKKNNEEGGTDGPKTYCLPVVDLFF